MPGVARQFEPQITRSGGVPSKYRFSAQCSQCHRTNSYETSTITSDDAVKGYFKDRGWLLGRARAYDLCSTCLATPRRTAESHPSPERPMATDKRHRDTADILARHLGKPEVLAAEVFRPREVQPPRPTAEIPDKTPPASTPSSELEQALIGMAADLKGLRSTILLLHRKRIEQ